MLRSPFLLVVAVAALVGCSKADGASTASVVTTAVAPAGSPAASAPAALQFSAPLVGGGALDFTQYAGRTVALWFWAPT